MNIINSKNNRIKYAVLIISSIIIFLCVYNDFSQYDSTIAKVTKVEDAGINQNISAEIMNGSEKGDTINLVNRSNDSLVYDNNYHKGNFVFISDRVGTDGFRSITGTKRDYFIVLALLVLFNLLLLIGGKQGFYTIIGLFVNVLVFYYALYQYTQGKNILLVSILASVFFSCLILILINGFNRISFVSIFATLITVLLVTGITAVVMHYSPRVEYEFMEFLPEPFTQADANLTLLAEVLVGCLGAIIDISVIMTSSASEIIKKNPEISQKKVFDSCRTVADDITGTMINIILLTNIAAFIPLYVLSLENGFRINTIIQNNMYFEIVRFLTGGIGIIIAIPISIYAASRFVKAVHKNDN